MLERDYASRLVYHGIFTLAGTGVLVLGWKLGPASGPLLDPFWWIMCLLMIPAWFIGFLRIRGLRYLLYPDRLVMKGAFGTDRVIPRRAILQARSSRLLGLRQVTLILVDPPWPAWLAPSVLMDVKDPEGVARLLSLPRVPPAASSGLHPPARDGLGSELILSTHGTHDGATWPVSPSTADRASASGHGGSSVIVWKVVAGLFIALLLIVGGAYGVRTLLTPDSSLGQTATSGYSYTIVNEADRSLVFEVYVNGAKVCAGELGTGFFDSRAICRPPQGYDGPRHRVKFLMLAGDDLLPREAELASVPAADLTFELSEFRVRTTPSWI